MCWVIRKRNNLYEIGYFYAEDYYVDLDKRTDHGWEFVYAKETIEEAFALCSYLNGGMKP